MTTISEKALLQRGYQTFNDPRKAGPGYVGSLGGWSRTKEGSRRYSIHVHVWELSHLDPNIAPGRSFGADTQLDTKAGTTFNAHMLIDKESLEEMEAFFERMFTLMECVDYDERH